nr:hypothetical protein [Tanacetum cinerariifolium]
MSDNEDETRTAENAPPKNVPQIITVTNIYAKFPYLKKGEYDILAMKMQNFILSSDLLCWNIVLKGNSAKSMTTDQDGNLKIRPPVTTEEHQQARFGENVESKKIQKSILKQRVSVYAGDVVAAAVSPQSEIEFAFMGLSTEAHKHAVKSLEKQITCHQKNQLAYKEKIRVLSYELEEKSNILVYRQKLIDQAA